MWMDDVCEFWYLEEWFLVDEVIEVSVCLVIWLGEFVDFVFCGVDLCIVGGLELCLMFVVVIFLVGWIIYFL